jgi:hypothetical protein
MVDELDGDAEAVSALVDPSSCRTHIVSQRPVFRERLADPRLVGWLLAAATAAENGDDEALEALRGRDPLLDDVVGRLFL